MPVQISPSALFDWISQMQAFGQPVLLDVREPWELQTASVTPVGVTLMRIPMGELGSRLHELDRSKPVACLCHHGVRSLQVANFLQHHGFAHVVNISGGINAWSQELDPTVPRY
jgi:rhodanese-related sulfurtransferase